MWINFKILLRNMQSWVSHSTFQRKHKLKQKNVENNFIEELFDEIFSEPPQKIRKKENESIQTNDTLFHDLKVDPSKDYYSYICKKRTFNGKHIKFVEEKNSVSYQNKKWRNKFYFLKNTV